MPVPQLGQLQKVDLRTVWSNEARDFTPWLAEPANLDLLGETVGIELELESMEKSVGPFSADLHCKNTIDGSWVVIENQLYKTDHSHLGQLVTYASGLEANTVIWIAERFTDEHRAALDWLNEISGEKFSFFGLEVELWKIGDSPAAPKFNIVSKPNDWSKMVQATSQGSEEPTEFKKVQLEFWIAFKAFMDAKSNLRCQKPMPQHWMNFAIGRTGFHLGAIASYWDSILNKKGPEIRTELWMDGPDAKTHFAALEAQRSTIESAFGGPLTWHSLPGKKACKINVRWSTDFLNRALWPEQHEWLRVNLERFHQVFAPVIAKLDVGEVSKEASF